MSTSSDQERATTPPAGGQEQKPDDGMAAFWAALRRPRIQRAETDRWVGGVCAGTAERAGIDPVLVRVAVVALALLGGLGVVLYAAAWLLLPDGRDRIEGERMVAGEVSGSAVAALTLLVAGFLVPDPWRWWRGDRLIDGGDVLGVVVIGALLVGLLVWLTGRADGGTAATPPATSPAPPSAAPAGAESTATRPAAPGQWDQPAADRPDRPEQSCAPGRPGPGPALTAAAGGLALLAAGVTWLAADLVGLPGRPQVLAACSALGVLALTVIGLALAGRRDGPVGFAATMVALLAVSLAVVPSWRTVALVGDSGWTPRSVSAAQDGGTLGIGDAVLDLGELAVLDAAADPASGNPVEIPVRLGIGDLTVRVPAGADVEVRGDVLIGEVLNRTDAQDRRVRTHVLGGSETVRFGGGDPVVVVDARVLIGQVTVEETR